MARTHRASWFGVSLALFAAATWGAPKLTALFAKMPHTEGAVLIDTGAPTKTQSVAACVKCHRDVVNQWRKSRHARAASNALFQSALKLEPKARCVRCHTPLTTENQARTGRAPQQGAAAEGINCAVCHLRDGLILTANPSSTALSQKSHALRYTPELSESAFCGACHEFHFHNAQGASTTFAIQSTFSEWGAYVAQKAARGEPAKSCVQCHMSENRPEGAGHALRGSHFLPALESALSGYIERDANGATLVLTAQNVGHRFPTGDLYRHLVVEVERGGKRRVVTRLRREHAWSGAGATRQKRRVADTTLEPDTPRRIKLPPGAERVVVVYAYTTDENARRHDLKTVRTRVPILELPVSPVPRSDL